MSFSTPVHSAISAVPKLPTELLEVVLAHIPRSELPRLIGVSKKLYQICSPLIYRSLILNNLHRRHGKSVSAEEVVEQMGENTIGMEGAVRLPLISLWEATVAPDASPLPLPHRFSYVTRLCLRVHHPASCSGCAPIDLSHLYSLQIISTFKEGDVRLDLCHPSHNPFTPSKAPSHPLHPTSPLLHNLRPRQVILGSTFSSLAGHAAGLWTDTTPFPPPWVDELVVFIGTVPLLPGTSFLSTLPDTVRRLTFVFQPVTQVSQQWTLFGGGGADIEAEGYDTSGEAVCFFETLADRCNGKALEVEIVGLECVDLDSVGHMDETVKEVQESVRSFIAFLTEKEGRSWEEAELQAARVVFVDRSVWDAREGKIREVRLALAPETPLIPKLPLDVLDLVIAHANRSDLPFTILLNRASYRKSLPLLYDRVCIGMWVYHEDDDPGCVMPAGQIPRGLNGAAIGLKGAAFIPIYNLPTHKVAFPSCPTLPHRFSYLTRLSLDTHGSHYCKDFRPLLLPNLDILQFLPERQRETPEYLDVCSRSGHDIYQAAHPQYSSPHCPLIGTLRPRQLRLGDFSTGLVGDAGGLWGTGYGFSRFPPGWLREITIFLGDDILANGRSFFSLIPSTVRRLTFVFESYRPKWAPNYGMGWDAESELDDSDDEEEIEDRGEASTHKLEFAWRRLARACQGQAEMVEIVGMENLDREWSRMPLEEAKEKLKEEVVKQMLKHGKKQAEVDKRIAGIVFLEREAWEEREG